MNHTYIKCYALWHFDIFLFSYSCAGKSAHYFLYIVIKIFHLNFTLYAMLNVRLLDDSLTNAK